MGQPAANGAATVTATDTHLVMVPTPGGPVPTPLPHAFNGMFSGGLVASVLIAGQPAAVAGSVAANQPPHLPTPPGTSFQVPPANSGTVHTGSTGVLIGGQPAARHGDPVRTCNDPVAAPVGQIVSTVANVMIG
ncbi:PAAR domain-containing protein [Agromyces sp. ISL-38]|uniref:PAAR domain-containing protein n=1 Tax=Agromyces sp. ISL-38 TaxID=2819107 RepID=UPI001BE6B81F|nr:PAAR domain-containing protein [Agromyces sp. ISL-38]MBT2498628.1 PAAR domain-containing protein [Agromyces sp. ISL-38]MBT2518856.1 PAAR domain-containing protein [Streptomyces sp. ISL-90]